MFTLALLCFSILIFVSFLFIIYLVFIVARLDNFFPIFIFADALYHFLLLPRDSMYHRVTSSYPPLHYHFVIVFHLEISRSRFVAIRATRFHVTKERR